MSAKKKDISQINKYLQGKLDNKAMHELERQTQDDPFFMDALDGYETAGNDQQSNLTEVEERLANRVKDKQHRNVLLWRVLPIAACLLLTLGIGYWLFKPEPVKLKYANNTVQATKTTKPLAKKPEDSLPIDKTENELEKVAAASPLKASKGNTRPSMPPNVIEKPAGDSVATESAVRDAKLLPAARMTTLNEPQDNPVGNIENLIQGKVAGLNTQTNTGTPGVRGTVNIRGVYGKSNSDSSYIGALKKSSSTNFVNVTGVVTDSRTGNVIPATVIALDGKGLTLTDVDGKFSVMVPEGAVLTAAGVGYIMQTIKLHKQTWLHFGLSANTQSLAETVVRGYVKRENKDNASSPYIITGKEVQDNPIGNVEQLLQGKVAPLNIQNNTGAPGMRGTVNIRGLAIRDTSAIKNGLVYPVTGTITDSKSGEVISGAILSQGGSVAIRSDTEGKFTFVNIGKSLLTVTMSGYLPKQVKIDGKADLKITLKKDKRTHPATNGINCKENLKFKKVFFENIAIAEQYTNEREERHGSVVSNAQFLKALKFIARYTLVSVRTDLKDRDVYYTRSTFAAEKALWLKWYEDNKCDNLR